jgi:hypothetical protein
MRLNRDSPVNTTDPNSKNVSPEWSLQKGEAIRRFLETERAARDEPLFQEDRQNIARHSFV